MKRTRNLASAIMAALGMDGPDEELRERPGRARPRPRPHGARRRHPDTSGDGRKRAGKRRRDSATSED